MFNIYFTKSEKLFFKVMYANFSCYKIVQCTALFANKNCKQIAQSTVQIGNSLFIVANKKIAIFNFI